MTNGEQSSHAATSPTNSEAVRCDEWAGGTTETVGRSERWWELQTWDTRYDVWLHVNSYTDEQEAVEAGERFAARPPQEQGCRVICVVEETLRSWGEAPPTAEI